MTQQATTTSHAEEGDNLQKTFYYSSLVVVVFFFFCGEQSRSVTDTSLPLHLWPCPAWMGLRSAKLWRLATLNYINVSPDDDNMHHPESDSGRHGTNDREWRTVSRDEWKTTLDLNWIILVSAMQSGEEWIVCGRTTTTRERVVGERGTVSCTMVGLLVAPHRPSVVHHWPIRSTYNLSHADEFLLWMTIIHSSVLSLLTVHNNNNTTIIRWTRP